MSETRTADPVSERTSCCGAAATYDEGGTLYCKACYEPVEWAPAAASRLDWREAEDAVVAEDGDGLWEVSPVFGAPDERGLRFHTGEYAVHYHDWEGVFGPDDYFPTEAAARAWVEAQVAG